MTDVQADNYLDKEIAVLLVSDQPCAVIHLITESVTYSFLSKNIKVNFISRNVLNKSSE